MSQVVCVLLVLLLNCFSFNANADSLDCQQQHCVGIVDAGSTGSRFHIYTYDLDENKSPVHITEKWSKKIKPGFASIDVNEASVNSYLTNLFSGAPQNAMPVYFYATAGMRLLPQSTQSVLYGYLKKWLNQQSQWELVDAKTLTGKEEGLFDWLAVNYQLGKLADKGGELTGVMDMGGASVQIAFPVSNNWQIDENDIQQIDLYGRHFTLFIHSFLGLGQTEVTHQFLDNETCFPNNYLLPQGTAAKGNVFQCKSAVSSLVNAVHQVSKTVQKAIRSNPVSLWYVMGGVVDTVKSKPFEFSNNEFNSQSMLIQGNNTVCQEEWGVLQTQYPGNDYLYGYCLYSAYYFSLMVEGYGIDSQKTLHYLASDNGTDWTVGAVLML